MYRTKEGSKNWDWVSKDERDQTDKNILKNMEPKLTKRRSLYRRDEDVKPIEQDEEEQQGSTANANSLDAAPQMVDVNQQDTDVQMGNVDESNNQNDDATVADQDTRLEQQLPEQQQMVVQQLQSEEAQDKASIAGLQTRNELLEAHNWELQRRIEKLETKNTDLEDENMGLRAAYEALRQSVQTQHGPVPSHTAMLEAVNTTIASQPAGKCQGYQGKLFEHTETYACENPNHSPFTDKVSCGACTDQTLRMFDPKAQRIVRGGGVVGIVCQRCCWSGGEHLREDCKCGTMKRCVMCVTALVDSLVEDAGKFEGKDMGKCLRCGKNEKAMVKVCVTCGGRRDV
ncbi:hypothetical protein AC578_4663 [Pseudocercospora eumusae]|uniref:Uncharacterized protein n=1 Tax=Pseudocercospora eumusae TaxID=321146 RepID=A0A139H7B8_9PEZI|nr:hypothetical protein AC578_4663 [Pseudocercospora eumusae]